MGRVVLAGGAGFIGRAVTRHLANSKKYDRFLVIGRRDAPRKALVDRAVYMKGDITDVDFLAGVLQPDDEVIDLSYSTVPKTSYENPLDEVTKNIPASVNLMHLCAMKNVRKYVLVSSGGTIYGNVDGDLIDENVSTNPISPYGISKIVSEKFAHFYHQNFGLKAVVVRPSNPYGRDQVGASVQGFIGAAISCLMNAGPVTVFGERGTIRDYIYIDDLAKGIIDCLEYGLPAEIYNIGTGKGMSNIEVLDAIETVYEKRFVEVIHAPERPFDVKYNVLDSGKLKSLCEWKPRFDIYSGLEMIKRGE